MPSPKQIESAEGSLGVRRIEHEGPNHAARAQQSQFVGLCPSCGSKCSSQLVECANESDVYGITGQPITRYCVLRDMFSLEDFEPHADNSRKYDISSDTVCDCHSENPRESMIGKSENDEYDKPDAQDAQSEDDGALPESLQHSHSCTTALSALLVTAYEPQTLFSSAGLNRCRP